MTPLFMTFLDNGIILDNGQSLTIKMYKSAEFRQQNIPNYYPLERTIEPIKTYDITYYIALYSLFFYIPAFYSFCV